MRITDQMTYNMLTSNIGSAQANVYDTQQKITSGLSVSKPSDDPGLYEVIKRLREDQAVAAQYQKNAANLEYDLTTTESVLSTMTELFQRASEVAVSAGNETIPSSDKVIMGEEVNLLLESLVSLANTSEGGFYIFGGTRTDTEPFSPTTDASGMITGITEGANYNGNQGVRQVEINKGIYMEANIPGSDATGIGGIFINAAGNLFDDLIQLRDDLLAGVDTVGTNHLDNLNSDLDHITNMRTVVGSRQQSVSRNNMVLDQRLTNIVSALDKNESIDVAQAMMELSQQQVAYEAALRATSGILSQRTLADYI